MENGRCSHCRSNYRRLLTTLQHLNCLRRPNPSNRVTQVLPQASLHQQVKQTPHIIAEPRVALYDGKVKIRLSGFPKHDKLTLHGEFCHERQKVIFASCGHYITDNGGQVNVCDQHSEGGTYEGVEPMGIIWSLKPAPGQPHFTRMTINFTDKPSVISVKVYRGHLDLNDIYAPDAQHQSLTEIQLERWFRFPDEVTRTEIEHGNVRGVLFLPSGDGPFQGVIDLFGSAGGSIEYRSALLASHGFATLSLPYFRYKDLPDNLLDVRYDYFVEALEWFASHPKVHKNGLGVVAVSKGTEFALCMSAFSKWIKAAVLINGHTYFGLSDLYYKDELFIKGSKFDVEKIIITEGCADISKAMTKISDIIPAWQNDTKLLFFVSQDDYQYDIKCTDYYLESCPDEKKKNVEVIKYPGAGHLLEPPYTALCRATVNKNFNMLMLFGGKSKEHAHAQEDSWQRTLEHLRKHIPTS